MIIQGYNADHSCSCEGSPAPVLKRYQRYSGFGRYGRFGDEASAPAQLVDGDCMPGNSPGDALIDLPVGSGLDDHPMLGAALRVAGAAAIAWTTVRILEGIFGGRE